MPKVSIILASYNHEKYIAASIKGRRGLMSVGEYIGKIYLETKRRPRYIVSEFLNET